MKIALTTRLAGTLSLLAISVLQMLFIIVWFSPEYGGNGAYGLGTNDAAGLIFLTLILGALPFLFIAPFYRKSLFQDSEGSYWRNWVHPALWVISLGVVFFLLFWIIFGIGAAF